MESLRGLSSPSANVIRHGNAKQIPSPELVPGDVVEVSLSLLSSLSLPVLRSLSASFPSELLLIFCS